MLSQHPLSLDGFCDPFNETNYFSVCYCIVLPNIVCLQIRFQAAAVSIVEKKIDSQARAENQTKHPIKKISKRHAHNRDSNTQLFGREVVSLTRLTVAAFVIERLGFI